jgi:hypothetical protein
MEPNNNNLKKRDSEHVKIINYLKNNNGIKLEELENGLILAEPCKGKKGKGGGQLMQVFPNNMWDILCYNKKGKELVVIEVKSEIADYNTFGQILHYLHKANYTCLNAELGESNVNKKRGIILAKEIDSSLKELVKKYKNATPEINLKEYKWEVEKGLSFEDITLSDDL